MGLFQQKPKRTDDLADEEDDVKNHGGSKRPADTAFKQQRLKAWQPILTPRAILPWFFVVGVVFAGISAVLIWGSSQMSDITLDYTECERLAPSNGIDELFFVDLPTFSYRLSASTSDLVPSAPQYALIHNPTDPDPGKHTQCIVDFDIPADLPNSVLMYYKLSNFHQNHRGYIKSIDADQLRGQAIALGELDGGSCAPLAVTEDKTRVIYPCGFIANSMFNDSFSDLTPRDPNGTPYSFSEKDIAWIGERKKYAASTAYSLDQIVPPPNWAKRYPDGYTTEKPPPDLVNDEHFQNWMRTAGLPTFSKLYKRNDNDVLLKGRYRIIIDLNFPVLPYDGTKSVVFSTVSWMGGKNPIMGYIYGGGAVALLLIAVGGTLGNCIKPRKLGDSALLSWNRY